MGWMGCGEGEIQGELGRAPMQGLTEVCMLFWVHWEAPEKEGGEKQWAVSPQKVWLILAPVPLNVTLLGNGIFANAIKDLKMRFFWI